MKKKVWFQPCTCRLQELQRMSVKLLGLAKRRCERDQDKLSLQTWR